MRRAPGLLLTACALAGCAVGPDYVKPAPAGSATGPFAETGKGLGGADLARPDETPYQWWRLYDDPALDGLVRQALAQTTDLQVAAANLAEARGLLNQARAGLFPSTGLSAGYTYGRSATADLIGSLNNEKASNSGYWSAGLDASYEIDLFGQVRRSIEAAKANAAALAAAQDAVRVTVAAETARAYADACAFGEEVEAARRSVDVVQQGYDITVRQRDAGGLSDFDVAREGTLLAQAQAQVPTFEGQRRSSLYQLAVLTGRPPEAAPAEAEACKAPPRLARPIPVGDGAAMLKRRPDVRQAERNLASATARIGVAVSQLYPTVTLGANASSAAQTLGGLGRYQNVAFGVGPLISWTFPNTLVAQAQIQQARAQASGALASFNGAVLGALKEAEQALAAYGGELDRHRALIVARDQAGEAARLAQVRFQAGGASFLDVLDSQRTLVDAQTALAASDEALVADQIQVFKALGGGWQDAPAVQPPARG